MLKRIFAKSYEILSKEGFVSLFKKFKWHFSIKLLRRKINHQLKKNEWNKYKNLYAGKRCFLIGNGPSLNKTPLYLLENEFTLTFNRFSIYQERLNWASTFFMVIDPLVAQNISDEINSNLPAHQLNVFPDIHNATGFNFTDYIDNAENVAWLEPDIKDFYTDLPKVGFGGTVAFPGLQVLVYLGFSEIYLVGVDVDYKIHENVKNLKGTDVESIEDDDPNHFDPRYFGKGKKFHQPVQSTIDNMQQSFRLAKEVTENLAVKIFNATNGGKLEVFQRVEFESLFDIDSNRQLEMMLAPIGVKPEGINLFENMSHAMQVSGKQEFNPMIGDFICSEEVAMEVFKKAIFTHLPLGPYKGEYLFSRRQD